MAYRIESRTSPAFRWRREYAKPHGECYPFDERGLRFESLEVAQAAADRFAKANAAQFRVVQCS